MDKQERPDPNSHRQRKRVALSAQIINLFHATGCPVPNGRIIFESLPLLARQLRAWKAKLELDNYRAHRRADDLADELAAALARERFLIHKLKEAAAKEPA